MPTLILVQWLTRGFPGSLKSHCLGVGCPCAWKLWLTYSTTGSIQKCHGSMDNLGCTVSWADCFLVDYVFFWISTQKTGMVPVPQANWADLDCWPTNDRKHGFCHLWSNFLLKYYFLLKIHLLGSSLWSKKPKMFQILNFLQGENSDFRIK